MSRKWGRDFVGEMIDRGRRELGGVLFEGSNVAQPMYPMRGGYVASKEAESPEKSNAGNVEHQQEESRDDRGRDDLERDV